MFLFVYCLSLEEHPGEIITAVPLPHMSSLLFKGEKIPELWGAVETHTIEITWEILACMALK